MSEIEDLVVGRCLRRCPTSASSCAPGMRRLDRITAHLDERSRCTLCVRECAAEAAATPLSNPDLLLENASKLLTGSVKAYPVVDPFGPMVTMDALKSAREAERAPRMELIQAIREKKLVLKPGHNDFLRYILTGEVGEWPLIGRTTRPNDTQAPWMRSAEVDAVIGPIVKRFVENIKAKTTDMPYEPFVMNGWDSYCDPKRHAAEVAAMRSDFLFAGISSDLGAKAHAFLRIELLGKSVLLTRDAESRFRAFENVCRHRGMELVTVDTPKGTRAVHICGYHSWSYGSDGQLLNAPFTKGFAGGALEGVRLTELPAGERCGILWVCPHPTPDADYAERLEDVLSPQLARELDLYQLGRNHQVARQTMRIDANWKLPIDTFGEAYHFDTLHPFLRDAFMRNRVARPFARTLYTPIRLPAFWPDRRLFYSVHNCRSFVPSTTSAAARATRA